MLEASISKNSEQYNPVGVPLISFAFSSATGRIFRPEARREGSSHCRYPGGSVLGVFHTARNHITFLLHAALVDSFTHTYAHSTIPTELKKYV